MLGKKRQTMKMEKVEPVVPVEAVPTTQVPPVNDEGFNVA